MEAFKQTIREPSRNDVLTAAYATLFQLRHDNFRHITPFLDILSENQGQMEYFIQNGISTLAELESVLVQSVLLCNGYTIFVQNIPVDDAENRLERIVKGVSDTSAFMDYCVVGAGRDGKLGALLYSGAQCTWDPSIGDQGVVAPLPAFGDVPSRYQLVFPLVLQRQAYVIAQSVMSDYTIGLSHVSKSDENFKRVVLSEIEGMLLARRRILETFRIKLPADFTVQQNPYLIV
jgi:hypothetical protein